MKYKIDVSKANTVNEEDLQRILDYYTIVTDRNFDGTYYVTEIPGVNQISVHTKEGYGVIGDGNDYYDSFCFDMFLDEPHRMQAGELYDEFHQAFFQNMHMNRNATMDGRTLLEEYEEYI